MKGSKRYSLGAAIADFYYFATVFGTAGGLYVAVNNEPVPIGWHLMMMLLLLAIVIVYHSLVARRVGFCTPGEAMMGRTVIDGRKEWTNPYGINRTALFIVLFFALISAGNSWDAATDERFHASLTLRVVALRAAVLGGLLVGLWRVGRAQSAGGPLVLGYFVFAAIGALLTEPTAGVPGNVRLGVGLFLVLTTLGAGIVLIYYYRARPASAETLHPAASG